jgi:hypothetical protein
MQRNAFFRFTVISAIVLGFGAALLGGPRKPKAPEATFEATFRTYAGGTGDPMDPDETAGDAIRDDMRGPYVDGEAGVNAVFVAGTGNFRLNADSKGKSTTRFVRVLLRGGSNFGPYDASGFTINRGDGEFCDGATGNVPAPEDMTPGQCIKTLLAMDLPDNLLLRCGGVQNDFDHGLDWTGTDFLRTECTAGTETLCTEWDIRPFEFNGEERLTCRLFERVTFRGQTDIDEIDDYDMPFAVTAVRQ